MRKGVDNTMIVFAWILWGLALILDLALIVIGIALQATMDYYYWSDKKQ